MHPATSVLAPAITPPRPSVTFKPTKMSLSPVPDRLLADFDSDDENTTTLPLSTCSTVSDLQATLQNLTQQETLITSRLQALLSTQNELSHSLTRLDLFRAHLGTQVVAARSLTNTFLSPAATTATRISSAVKRLDVEQSRVKATLEVVEQVSELKACVLGVTGSMGAPQDWETAASYLHRASKVPEEIITGPFAEEMVPTAEVPDTPSVTLNNAAESLCGLFLREFEKAVTNNDGEKVTRFFKLFPLIGRADVGLEVYGKYVCGGVAGRARAALGAKEEGGDDFFYGNVMTRLFEHIASIVEQHGTLVEKHYGRGKMVRVVERLQMEADTQGGIIIDAFGDERAIDRKLTDIKSYAYSFLVQSYLPRNSAINTPRSNSPAPGGPGPAAIEEEGVEVKEVDKLLTEMGVMLSRWSLYCRFLARKFQESQTSETPEAMTLPPVITMSMLSRKINDKLIAPFTAMTTYFCRRSVEKAFQLDESPSDLTLSLTSPASTTSNPPYITSAVDDVMYILNNLLQRAVQTSHPGLLLTVISTISRVLTGDFTTMIQRKLRDEFPAKPALDDKLLPYLLLLNNLDISLDYIHRIITSFTSPSPPLSESFPFGTDAAQITTALNSLESTFTSKTSELLSEALALLFNNLLKPRLRPLLAEAFRDVDYHSPPPQEDYDEVRDEEVVKDRFQASWEALTMPLKRILTEKNFDKLLVTLATHTSKLLEKRIWAYSGRISELGAIRLERDVVSVVGVVVRRGRYGLREGFARCLQICLVVNMEEDEVLGAMGDGDEGDGVDWVLSLEERRRARDMVVE
ncbi:Golgi transport complex subunit 4 [Rhizina undulata]